MLATLHAERFADQPPAEVYATLLDEGRYLCSIRTMYRLLAGAGEVRERRNPLRHPRYVAPMVASTSAASRAHPSGPLPRGWSSRADGSGRTGHVVKIWHLRALMTVYAHNLENLVKVGDWVEQGQVIATVGRTGRASAPHLHFENRLDGRKYDPMFWLPETGVLAASTGEPGRAAAVP